MPGGSNPRSRGTTGQPRDGRAGRGDRRAAPPSLSTTAEIVFGLGAWIAFGSLYLLIFWSLAGQTPGMRLISIGIEDYESSPQLGLRRAFRRLVGLALAVIPFGLGLLGVLTNDDRRGWWDRLAGTDVVPVDPLAPYSSRAGAAQ